MGQSYSSSSPSSSYFIVLKPHRSLPSLLSKLKLPFVKFTQTPVEFILDRTVLSKRKTKRKIPESSCLANTVSIRDRAFLLHLCFPLALLAWVSDNLFVLASEYLWRNYRTFHGDHHRFHLSNLWQFQYGHAQRPTYDEIQVCCFVSNAWNNPISLPDKHRTLWSMHWPMSLPIFKDQSSWWTCWRVFWSYSYNWVYGRKMLARNQRRMLSK